MPLGTTLGVIDDACIGSGLPDLNLGTGTTMLVGAKPIGKVDSLHRPLLRFDGAGLPIHATVSAATLTLKLSSRLIPGPANLHGRAAHASGVDRNGGHVEPIRWRI
jgi:hypothetical protein